MYRDGRIKIGIIGASPNSGWAMHSHLPALIQLQEYQLQAVANTNDKSAKEAQAKFGFAEAYSNYKDLIDRPEIDLVTVAIKAPDHYDVVKYALNAGRSVYCEWPLGKNLAQTKELAALAKDKNISTIIGLQARAIPEIRQIKQAIIKGLIGKVLSTNMVASAEVFGETASKANAYMHDKNNGATMLSIQFGHYSDIMCRCLGEFVSFTSNFATQRKSVRILETNEFVENSSPDQMVVTGMLENDVFATIHVKGGHCQGNNFLWEINGTDGDVIITAPIGLFHHLKDLDVRVKDKNGELISISVFEENSTLNKNDFSEGPSYNVAQLYRNFSIEDKQVPTFEDAVIRHEFINKVELCQMK